MNGTCANASRSETCVGVTVRRANVRARTPGKRRRNAFVRGCARVRRGERRDARGAGVRHRQETQHHRGRGAWGGGGGETRAVMGFFGRSKSKKRAEAAVSAEEWLVDENEMVRVGSERGSLRDSASPAASKAGSRSGELSENGSSKRLSVDAALREESKDTLSEFPTYSDSRIGRQSLRRRSLELQRRVGGIGLTTSKKALVDAAIDEVIAGSLEVESSHMAMEEVGVFRTMYHTVRRLVDLEDSKRAHGLETDPEQTLVAIRNALNVSNALILQSHGSEASRQATDLLDPIAKGFVAQFFEKGQNMTSVVLAQSMAQLSLEMKAPHFQTGFDTDISTSNNVSKVSLTSANSNLASDASDGHWNEDITSWTSFDVRQYAASFAGKKKGPLESIANTLFDHFDLFAKLPLKSASVATFMRSVEAKYRDNDYHNHIHATDVTQAMAYFIETSLLEQIDPIHIFVLLTSAIVHDVGHPGVNNPFLVNTLSDDAVRWNNVSVNENGHLFTAFSLMKQCDVLAGFSVEDRAQIKKWMQKMVLFTDMEFHTELVQRAMKCAADETVDGVLKPVKEWNEIWVPLAYILHCADISNPARPYDLALSWAVAVTDEFYKQGDRQRAMGMSVDGFMDRDLSGPGVTQTNQLGFIRFVVKPTLLVMQSFAPEAAKALLTNLEENIDLYEADVAAAKQSTTQTT